MTNRGSSQRTEDVSNAQTERSAGRVGAGGGPARHAKGFGQYVNATLERRHSVTATYEENGKRYCAVCSFPVVQS